MRHYLTSLAIFFVVDLLWLGVVAADFYRSRLADFLRPETLWPAAIAFYLIYLAGLNHFVIRRARSIRDAALNGAAFGFVTYCAFDLTALALFQDFPLSVVTVDLVWGALLGATVSAGTFRLRGAYPETSPPRVSV